MKQGPAGMQIPQTSVVPGGATPGGGWGPPSESSHSATFTGGVSPLSGPHLRAVNSCPGVIADWWQAPVL